MLQALQHGVHAMIVSLLSNFVAYLLFAYILFYTNKHNVKRLMYLYTCTIGFGAVVGCALLAYPLYKLYKKSKQHLEQKGGNTDIQEDQSVEQNDLKSNVENENLDSKYLDSEDDTGEKDSNSDTNEVNGLPEI